MKWFVTVLILAFPATSMAQEARFGGTFIGAMVAEDGIVMAADSRSTFVDESGSPMGYVDRLPKIFVQHGSAFAVSGLISVDGDLFSSFIRQNDFLLGRPVQEILTGVSLWLPFKNSTKVLLISAGYDEGEPTICVRAPNDPQMCQKSGFITNRASHGLRQWISARDRKTPKVGEAVAALKMAIREAADLDSTIGGPTSVLFLPRSGPPVWLENPTLDNGWKRVCDIVTEYRRGRIPIFFTNTKDELDRHLAGVCPK